MGGTGSIVPAPCLCKTWTLIVRRTYAEGGVASDSAEESFAFSFSIASLPASIAEDRICFFCSMYSLPLSAKSTAFSFNCPLRPVARPLQVSAHSLIFSRVSVPDAGARRTAKPAPTRLPTKNERTMAPALYPRSLFAMFATSFADVPG